MHEKLVSLSGQNTPFPLGVYWSLELSKSPVPLRVEKDLHLFFFSLRGVWDLVMHLDIECCHVSR